HADLLVSAQNRRASLVPTPSTSGSILSPVHGTPLRPLHRPPRRRYALGIRPIYLLHHPWPPVSPLPWLLNARLRGTWNSGPVVQRCGSKVSWRLPYAIE